MTPSFKVVNFSLRTNKSIERSLVFEGLKILQEALDFDNALYVGFGSIWFTDFTLAHRLLRIRDMVSIEADEVGAKRAAFNRPFKTVRVEQGDSATVLPTLLDDAGFKDRPWLVWLDYDRSLSAEKVADMRIVIERAPRNTVLLVTLNAELSPIARQPVSRPEELRKLLGSVVPDDVQAADCSGAPMASTLGRLLLDFMVATAAAAGRPGGFVKAFQISYRDGAQMLTLGGVLPAKGARSTAEQIVRASTWPGFPEAEVAAPQLTLRETAALQAELPLPSALTRATVRSLGFDLEDDEIAAFQRYYLYYPTYSQITT